MAIMLSAFVCMHQHLGFTNFSLRDRNAPFYEAMTLIQRLEKIVDYVATSDRGANTLVQKVNGLAGEKTCACLVPEDVPQSRPELWDFIQKIEFGFCIYPNAHAYLCNNSRVPPVMQGIKGGFRLFTTATPFIGGPLDFINIARLVTQWETDA